MKGKPKVGSVGTIRFKVESHHTIDFSGGGLPPVLSTPSLINYLEKAAREAIAENLESGETSLGIELDVQHLAPTPPGHWVTCTAKVIYSEGNVVSFQVEAADEIEPIARGTHKRAIVLVERFARRVAKKSASHPPS